MGNDKRQNLYTGWTLEHGSTFRDALNQARGNVREIGRAAKDDQVRYKVNLILKTMDNLESKLEGLAQTLRNPTPEYKPTAEELARDAEDRQLSRDRQLEADHARYGH